MGVNADRKDVLVLGDGASAVALVYALAKRLRHRLSVGVIGRGAALGEGIAYASRNRLHVLNAPAEAMSIDPDDPACFVRWLNAKGENLTDWEDQFVPRHLYGEHLADLVGRAREISRGFLHLETFRSEALGLIATPQGWILSHAGGSLAARNVVLATGNDMPTPIAGTFGPEVASLIIDNPRGKLDIDANADVLLLGSGLTAIDALLTLTERGHRGRITLLSRHELLPAAHVKAQAFPPLEPPYPETARRLIRALRSHVGAKPDAPSWQGFMNAMRPKWQEVWHSLPADERRRFIRHGAAIWNVHRYRMAPRIATRLQDLSGVAVMQGKLRRIFLAGDAKLAVGVTSRGKQTRLLVNYLVNCSGPNSDPAKTHDPLIENLVASRLVRTSPAGAGLDVDENDRVVNQNGSTHRTLFAMGALTKGRWWEITAIPEISRKADRIALNLVERSEVSVPREGESYCRNR
jgi:uncharacterized NAD(P)/FAD-binding protein YdhS